MSSSFRPSLAPPTPLQVLVVSANEEVRSVARAALESSGDVARIAGDLAGAISIAEEPHVAFVDVTLPAGTALAVVHHLVGSEPRCAVYAIAPVNELAQGAEAMSLGAKGLVVAPITGDAILQSIADVRAQRALRDRMSGLEAARDALAEQCDLLIRSVRVARSGDIKQVAETVAGLVAIVTGARGVAVFGPEDRERSRTRLASFGTTLDLRERYSEAELADLAAQRSASVHALSAEDRPLGCVLVERAKNPTSPRLPEVLEFANAMMALTQAARAALEDHPTMPRSRGLPMSTFERLLEREVDSANQGNRVFSLLCVLPDPGGTVDLARLSVPLAEPGSICGVGSNGEVYLLLARTSPIAARAMARAIPYRSVAVSAFPTDAHIPKRLVRVAETRARDAWRSPVIAHGLAALSLSEIARVLLEAPVLDARISSVFPLELTQQAVSSLALHACRQALRGQVRVHVGSGFLLERVAREAVGPDRVIPHAIKHAPGCEDLEVLVVMGELGTWSVIGKTDGDRIRAVHSADPLLASVLSERLERIAQRSVPPPPRKESV